MATSSDKDPLGGSKFKVDPEYEALVPMPPREAYLALRESIRKDGQLMPIIVNENFVVLDGHQRLRACNELGITPAYEMTTFASRLDEKSFVIKTNLVRRQMKKIDRIQAVCNLEAIEKEKAKARQLAPLLHGRKPPLAQNCANGEKERGKVSAILAKAAGVSQTTFEEARYVLKHGTPAQISRIRYSGATIHGTYKLLRTAAKLPFTGKVVQVSEAVQLIHGDYRTVTDRDLAQTQIKLIIGAADPFAGGTKTLNYRELAIFAERVLQPGGFVVFSVDLFNMGRVESIIARETEYLQKFWPFIAKMPSSYTVSPPYIDSHLLAYLVYYKGELPKLNDPFLDFMDFDDGHQAPYDEVLKHLISALTIENERVCDPTSAGGLLGHIAVAMKRRFVGVEGGLEKIRQAKKTFRRLGQNRSGEGH